MPKGLIDNKGAYKKKTSYKKEIVKMKRKGMNKSSIKRRLKRMK